MNDDGPVPIELVALDQPYEGVIAARRAGEPGFSHVQDVADAIMAALSRGCDLVVPAALFAEIRQDLPPDLPDYIKIR
ncbi:hypothetical protein SAMN05443575_3870 [Jatrophihabitans endophyticus]|uniref:Uncharacterized protein n=1 Tax=Jatrophihabitans endophyticus TaxID=1206085 RepID=A0A1M5SZP2_9ACTN|nr:hypothetical protein [Jatrophihabitans endophyticus]SHH43974.1 hypothetical protein SAMN05443575_3870 [Jatrophihabitans endophyticus]